jgi:hypothetical protein
VATVSRSLAEPAALRPQEACFKAVTEVLGIPQHVYFIQVKTVWDEQDNPEQVAVHDPYDRLEYVRQLNDGNLMTVKVPGYEGDYLTVIFPFAR